MTADFRPRIGRDELRQRLRQQELIAAFGGEALRAPGLAELFQEAARVAAEGLGTDFAKVLEHIVAENALVVRAGVGWHEGVVGVLKLGADLASPAGYALRTGQPVISNHLSGEDRFRTPVLLAEHGVRRAVNVIICGEADGPPFGVLEADSRNAEEEFSPRDVDFLQALANTLGLAIDRERDRRQRELLTREAHHRIKNSLQIAQSLLRLQAVAVDHDEARLQLEEAAHRIMTIAAVHERLFAGPDIGRVAVAPYLRGLIADLHASLGIVDGTRALTLEIARDAEDAVWGADRVTTLGLVATELITNAIKYGRGEVLVRLETVAGAGDARLVVQDEGDGPPADFNPARSRGLGMRLLASLLRDGGLELDRTAVPGRVRFIASVGDPAESRSPEGAPPR